LSVALKQQPEPELRLDVVEGRDAFVQLEREWNAALGRGPRDEPMLRHEWLRAWIENFAPGVTLRTFLARAGKEICAAAIHAHSQRARNPLVVADLAGVPPNLNLSQLLGHARGASPGSVSEPSGAF